MYCSNCGNYVDDNVRFCPNCGAEIQKKPGTSQNASYTQIEPGDNWNAGGDYKPYQKSEWDVTGEDNLWVVYKKVLKKYATFSGRARRREYWLFTLMNSLIAAAFGVLISAFGEESAMGSLFSGLSGLYSLSMLVPGLAVCWRRLHDAGKSGGYYFMFLIPLVGPILLLVKLCKDSEPGENRFGANPKQLY